MADSEKEEFVLNQSVEVALNERNLEESSDNKLVNNLPDKGKDSSNTFESNVSLNSNPVAKEDVQLLQTKISIDTEEDISKKLHSNLKSTLTDCSNISAEKQSILVETGELKPLNLLTKQNSSADARLEDSKHVLENSTTYMKEAKHLKTEQNFCRKLETICEGNILSTSVVHTVQTPNTSRQETSEVTANEIVCNISNDSQIKSSDKSCVTLSKEPAQNDNLNKKTFTSFYCTVCKVLFDSIQGILCHMRMKHNTVYRAKRDKSYVPSSGGYRISYFNCRSCGFIHKPKIKFQNNKDNRHAVIVCPPHSCYDSDRNSTRNRNCFGRYTYSGRR